jgi:hypothetical protein
MELEGLQITVEACKRAWGREQQDMSSSSADQSAKVRSAECFN